MRQAIAAVSILSLGCLIAGGCSAQRPAASMAVLRPDRPVLSLGAGDALGRAVYVNDLVLAAKANNLDTSAVANATESYFIWGE